MKLKREISWVRQLWTVCICIGSFVCAFAQNDQVFAETNVSEVNVHQAFNVTYTAKNLEVRNIEVEFGEFRLISGPNTSRSMQIINGKATSSTSYTYTLSANEKGRFTIPAATFETNAGRLTTNKLSIVVTEAKQIQGSGDDIFARLEYSKDSLYAGEQMLADIVLYTRKNINNVSFQRAPSFQNCYTSEVKQYNNQASNVAIDGKTYTRQIVSRYAVFPMQSGTFEVGPIFINAHVVVDGGRSSFFFRDTRKEQLVIPEAKFQVYEWPKKPLTFSGCIGQVSMQELNTQSQVSLGEAIEIQVRLDGYSDPNIVDAPKLKVTGDAEIYEPTLEYERMEDVQGRKKFVKTWKYLIVPAEMGKYEVQPFIVTFNPMLKQYDTLFSETTSFHIAPPQNQSETNSAIINNNSEYNSNSWFQWWYLIPIALLILLFLFRNSFKLLSRNAGHESLKRQLKQAINQEKVDQIKAVLTQMMTSNPPIEKDKVQAWIRQLDNYLYSPIRDEQSLRSILHEIKQDLNL